MTARLVALDVAVEPAAPDTGSRIEARLAILEGLQVLAPRERAAIALHYLADLPVDEVAKAMGTSPNTVKTQCNAIYRKLAVSSRASAVQAARELGLL